MNTRKCSGETGYSGLVETKYTYRNRKEAGRVKYIQMERQADECRIQFDSQQKETEAC